MPTIKERHAVLISHGWGSYEINVDVTRDGIGIQMSLEDFLDAVSKRVKRPATIIGQAGLLERLRMAAEEVCREMKDETKRVM